MKYQELRKKYPRFIYEKYSYKISGNSLEIFFNFKTEPNIKFQPKVIIENVGDRVLNPVRNRKFLNGVNNLIFHIGLMEIPSYWKATCSPEIIIKAGPLSKEQIKWWKDLIINGMGQFFYENKINFRKPNFLKISSINIAQQRSINVARRRSKRVLVPVGGGKDSIVTLEKMKASKKKIGLFLVNPGKIKVLKNVVKVSGIKDVITVERKIDPTLLELNKKGYLNGHTPFTAVLSFLSVFCAVLFNYRNIAFSNEKSANEGNVKYLGKVINHQWARSSEFERKFKIYCKKYLAKDINYFSYLRPYTELEISKMFTKYPKYFSAFSSCNVVVAKKLKKKWCGNCPKCLFVYATLYPFLEKEQLLKIFGKDIFGNKKLLPIMQDLIGRGVHKPFECVGTFKESRQAFKLSLEKAKKLGKIPYLLTKFNK